jgi:transposase
MSYMQGFDRHQINLFPQAIDEMIEADHLVRVIDVFVDSLDVVKLGFKDVRHNTNGRPPYHPKDLLKLYIYSYMDRFRSSRVIEKECKRNVEVMWLLSGLAPDHNTISNFRRDNHKAIKAVFRQTVSLARNMNLIGGVLIAGDSTKLRAQNSKKKNFNEKKIQKHISYIEEKIEAYNKELAEADGDKKELIQEKIKVQQSRKEGYEQLEEDMKASGESQISLSDPDSRQLVSGNNSVEVGYNIQSTVDAKNKIPLDYQVSNQSDKKAMSNMVARSKSILRTSSFTALFDKGYHSGNAVARCHQMGIEVLVAMPAKPPSAQAVNPAYRSEKFIYDQEKDQYICPAGEVLKTKGVWYQKNGYRSQYYKTKACKTCAVRDLCTKAAINGRVIERSEYTLNLERNKEAIENNPKLYKQRQAIVEHPFGTMKRSWGFNHIMTKKGIKRASADVGFIFIAYNLRRMISIIGIKELKKRLRAFCLESAAIFEVHEPKGSILSLLYFSKSSLSFLKLAA